MELFKDQGNQQYQPIWKPDASSLVNPGQVYVTPSLSPGFYVAAARSTGERDFFGLSLASPSLYGGVSGGWLDSVTGVGFAAFDIPFPRKVTLKLLFGGSYGELGAAMPFLEVYYQERDGTRTLYWSAPSLSPQEPINIDPIFVSQITAPNVELGFIGTTGKETMGIFGTKDSQGRLVSINRITFGSQTDKNQSLSITLDANYLPATMEFPDGSKVEYSNYTNDGATATFYHPDGSVASQAFVKMSLDALRKGAEALKKYVESPQPTVDSFMPSTRSGMRSSYDDCVKAMTNFHDAVDGLIWGGFQLASIASCGAAAGATAVSGGLAIPLAIVACGSVVLNGVARMEKVITGEKDSPIQNLNSISSTAQTSISCVKKDWGGCVQGVAEKVIDKKMEGWKPGEICDGVVAKFSGSVADMEQNPIGGITIKLPLRKGDASTISANGSYSFEIPASNKQLPDFFVISASGEGYIPVSKNISKTGASDYLVDFVMEKISDDVVVLELEPNVHHLGDDSFSGSENSQFQRGSEGDSYTKDFEVNDFQLSFAQAEISLLAKGLQHDNTLSINGMPVGSLGSSPADGSFTNLTFSVDTVLLSPGSNNLQITAASTVVTNLWGDSKNDLDDFEFTNIIIRFKQQSSSNESPTEEPPSIPPTDVYPVPPSLKDGDGDGVMDDADKCPSQPAQTADGCPVKDTDGDGVADDKDKCPSQPAQTADGCPVVKDTDGDGVVDEQDNCPDKSANTTDGCPVPPTTETGTTTTVIPSVVVILTGGNLLIEGKAYMEQTSCLLPTVHNDYCAPRLIKNGSFQMSYWLALAEDSRAKVTVPIDEEGNFSVSCENFPEGNDKEICKNATWFTAHTPDGTGWAGIWGMAQWNGLVVKELIFRQCSIDQNTPCKATY